MHPAYRFVRNRDTAITTVAAAVTGFDARLSDQAGELFERLDQTGRLPVGLSSAEQAFVNRSRQYGWIGHRGRLNGTFRVAPAGPHLKRAQVEVGTLCNLQCTYCYSESGPTAQSQLDADTVVGLLSDAERMGVTWVDFTGGEFLLFPEWTAVVRAARERGLVVSVHTNGTLLTTSTVARLAKLGVRQLQISADSHRAEVHDGIRHNRGALDRMVTGVERARQVGLPVRICLMVHKHNQDHVAEAARWFHRRLGVDVVLDRVITAGGDTEARTAVSTAEYYEIIAPLVASQEHAATTRICDATAEPVLGDVEPFCGVAHSFVYVTAEGEVALCPTMTSRDREMFTGPSLASADLPSIWYDSDYFNSYRGTNCRNTSRCPAATRCGGGCRSNAYLDTGEVDAPDPLACNLHKNPTGTFVDFPTRYHEGNFLPVHD